jgi:hypothetical protein
VEPSWVVFVLPSLARDAGALGAPSATGLEKVGRPFATSTRGTETATTTAAGIVKAALEAAVPKVRPPSELPATYTR